VARAVTIALQRLGKQTLNNRTTVFHGVRAEELSWRPSESTGESSKRIETRSTAEYKRSACEDVKCELKALFEVCDSVRLNT
jgi:hypothetical protein